MFIEVKKNFCPNIDKASSVDNVVNRVGSVVLSILPFTTTARVQFAVTAVNIYIFLIAILVFHIFDFLTTLIDK